MHRLVGCIPIFCTNTQLVLLARGSASSLSLRCRTTSCRAHTPRKASHVHGHNTKLYNRQGSGRLHWLHVRTLQSLFTAWPTSQCKPAAHTAPSSQSQRLLEQWARDRCCQNVDCKHLEVYDINLSKLADEGTVRRCGEYNNCMYFSSVFVCLFVGVCVWVCACVRACVRACVCVCVCPFLFFVWHFELSLVVVFSFASCLFIQSYNTWKIIWGRGPSESVVDFNFISGVSHYLPYRLIDGKKNCKVELSISDVSVMLLALLPHELPRVPQRFRHPETLVTYNVWRLPPCPLAR